MITVFKLYAITVTIPNIYLNNFQIHLFSGELKILKKKEIETTAVKMALYSSYF